MRFTSRSRRTGRTIGLASVALAAVLGLAATSSTRADTSIEQRVAKVLGRASSYGAATTPGDTSPSSAGATGTPAIRFQATITGNIHDSGGVTSTEAILQQQPPEFNGCAIIKHKHTELGLYTLEVRVNRASFLLGGWEKGAVDFSIADYRPNVSTYASPSIGGKFAFKGHAYGASVTYSRVQVRNGGRSGTYTDQHAYNLVPGTANAFTSAGTLTFRANWNCASVFHLSES